MRSLADCFAACAFRSLFSGGRGSWLCETKPCFSELLVKSSTESDWRGLSPSGILRHRPLLLALGGTTKQAPFQYFQAISDFDLIRKLLQKASELIFLSSFRKSSSNVFSSLRRRTALSSPMTSVAGFGMTFV